MDNQKKVLVHASYPCVNYDGFQEDESDFDTGDIICDRLIPNTLEYSRVRRDSYVQ